MIQLADVKKYKKQVKRLYHEAFPKCERAPFFFLRLKAKEDTNAFYAVVDEDAFVGLVYTIRNEKMVYVFYLAIAEEQRGNGYGSKVLSLIKAQYPNHVVTLAIEDTADRTADNYAQRIKRLGFYERNGFTQLQIRVNEAGVVYELLGTESGVTQAEYLDLMRNYLGAALYKLVYRRTKFE